MSSNRHNTLNDLELNSESLNCVFDYKDQECQCGLGPSRELLDSHEVQMLCSPLNRRMQLEDEAFANQV